MKMYANWKIGLSRQSIGVIKTVGDGPFFDNFMLTERERQAVREQLRQLGTVKDKETKVASANKGNC